MAFTYSKLAESTVGSGGAATIAFNNIPQNYTDLVLKLSHRGSTTSGAGRDSLFASLSFNGGAITPSTKFVRATAGGASSTGGPTGGYVNSSAFTASSFSNTEIYIPNYSGSSLKSYSMDSVTEQNTSGWDTILGMGALLLNSVAAINSISMSLDYGNFVQYSTATLYGIRVEL
jgi:hypothetical protein